MLQLTRTLLSALFLLLVSDATASYIINGERKSFEIRRASTAPVIDVQEVGRDSQS